MALSGIKRISGKMGYKHSSTGPWSSGKPSVDGGVGKCGHYDEELDMHGYCRDRDCKRERFIEALHNGEAIRMPDGTIIWTPGIKVKDDL